MICEETGFFFSLSLQVALGGERGGEKTRRRFISAFALSFRATPERALSGRPPIPAHEASPGAPSSRGGGGAQEATLSLRPSHACRRPTDNEETKRQAHFARLVFLFQAAARPLFQVSAWAVLLWVTKKLGWEREETRGEVETLSRKGAPPTRGKAATPLRTRTPVPPRKLKKRTHSVELSRHPPVPQKHTLSAPGRAHTCARRENGSTAWGENPTRALQSQHALRTCARARRCC